MLNYRYLFKGGLLLVLICFSSSFLGMIETAKTSSILEDPIDNEINNLGYVSTVDGTAARSLVPDIRESMRDQDGNSGFQHDLEAELLYTFNDFTDGVESLEFSPDGQYLATATKYDLRLLNLSSRSEVFSISIYSSRNPYLAFYPSGMSLAIACHEAIRIISIPSGNETGLIDLQVESSITSLKVNSYGDRLIAGFSDGSVIIWDTISCSELHQIDAHRYSVESIACSPNGRILATGSYSYPESEPPENDTLKLWDIYTGENIRNYTPGSVADISYNFPGDVIVINGYRDTPAISFLNVTSGTLYSINCSTWQDNLAVSPDDRYAVTTTGYPDYLVFFWDMETGHRIGALDDHSYSISCLDIHPSGQILVTGSYQTVYLWHIDLDGTRSNFTSLNGHSGAVVSTAFTPDGKILATGSHDGNVKLWNVTARAEILTIENYLGQVRSLDISPDGSILAIGFSENYIVLWNMNDHEEIGIINGYGYCIDFSPDGNYIVGSRSDSESVYLYDVSTRQQIRRVAWNAGNVRCVAFSPGGAYIATGTINSYTSLRFWDVTTGDEIFEGVFDWSHDNYVNHLAFHPSGELIATVTSGLTVWNISSGTAYKSFTGGGSDINTASFNVDGDMMAVGYTDGLVKLWDVENNWEIQSLEGHLGTVYDIAFNPVNSDLATVSYDSTAKIWEIHAAVENSYVLGHSGSVNSVAFDLYGYRMALGSDDGSIRTWNVFNDQGMYNLTGHEDAVNCVVFSPNGTLLASASNDTTVKLWVADMENVFNITLAGHAGSVTSVAFSPNGTLLASASNDATVKLWNMDTCTEVETLAGHAGSVTSVAFSPNGTLLASTSNDTTVKLWNVDTCTEVETLAGHAGSVTSVAFSPNGTLLATASNDTTVKLWNVDSGTEVKTLAGHAGTVTGVVFNVNGDILVSVSLDSSAKFWNATTGQLIRTQSGPLGGITSFALHPSGYLLAACSDEPEVTMQKYVLYSSDYHCLKGHSSVTTSLDLNIENSVFATASDDWLVLLWDIYNQTVLKTLRAHTGPIADISLSPDGMLLASGGRTGPVYYDMYAGDNGNDTSVRIWNTSTGSEIFRLDNHNTSLSCVKFCPTGGILASASDDGIIILWNSSSGELINVLSGHYDRVTSLDFSFDGTILVSVSYDGNCVFWNVTTGEMVNAISLQSSYNYFVDCSPNASLFAIASSNGYLEVRNLITGSILWDNDGLHYIQSLSFSPDGGYLAVSHSWSDSYITLFKTLDGVELLGHREESTIFSIAFDPVNSTLAYSLTDHSVKIWRINMNDLDGDGISNSWEETYGFSYLDYWDSLSDKDSDNLPNIIEYRINSSPVSADTDLDEIPDGIEYYSGLNATFDDAALDKDGDGMTNLYEYQNDLLIGFNDALDDRDQDGLPNLQEFTFGSRANQVDTDNDGIDDNYEYRCGLDPNVDDTGLDSDSDGMTNYWEYIMGLNASIDDANGDLDVDGLPNIWEYQMGLNACNSSDADTDVDGDGLSNVQEYSFGSNINLADTDADGMDDLFEYQMELDPIIDDSALDKDEDGMSNFWEFQMGLNANNAGDAGDDNDSDGLTNLKEYQLGLNATNSDCDGDGLSDGDEVNKYKTNPLDDDTDGDGIPDGQEVSSALIPLLPIWRINNTVVYITVAVVLALLAVILFLMEKKFNLSARFNKKFNREVKTSLLPGTIVILGITLTVLMVLTTAPQTVAEVQALQEYRLEVTEISSNTISIAVPDYNDEPAALELKFSHEFDTYYIGGPEYNYASASYTLNQLGEDNQTWSVFRSGTLTVREKNEVGFVRTKSTSVEINLPPGTYKLTIEPEIEYSVDYDSPNFGFIITAKIFEILFYGGITLGPGAFYLYNNPEIKQSLISGESITRGMLRKDDLFFLVLLAGYAAFLDMAFFMLSPILGIVAPFLACAVVVAGYKNRSSIFNRINKRTGIQHQGTKAFSPEFPVKTDRTSHQRVERSRTLGDDDSLEWGNFIYCTRCGERYPRDTTRERCQICSNSLISVLEIDGEIKKHGKEEVDEEELDNDY